MNTLLIIIEQICLYLPLVFGAYISMSLLKLPDLSIETAYVFGAILGSQTIANFIHTPRGITLILALLAAPVLTPATMIVVNHEAVRALTA